MKKTKLVAIASLISVAVSFFSICSHAVETQDDKAVSSITVEDYASIIGEYSVNGAYDEMIRQKEAKLEQKARSVSSSAMYLNINQVAQETNYWCGYAAIKSLLDYEGVSMTQTQIANEVYDADEACPWYLANGDSLSQFPVPNFLKRKTNFTYIPFPYGGAGTTEITANDITTRVVNTIDDGHGVLACGTSYGASSGHASILPGYPASNITHWLAVYGYSSYGSVICIADPAKSSAISWSGNINRYYTVSATKLASFAHTRGLIW